jgi:tetratricopeptide (TPR) repeat protein
MSLAMAATSLGDLGTALAETEDALRCFARIQHTSGILLAVGDLGDSWFRLGDIGRALHYFEEALELQPPVTGTAYMILTNLAHARRVRGQHAEALRLDSECLAHAEQTGATRLIGVVKLGLAMTHLDLGDAVTAEPLFLAANSAAVEFGTDVDAFDALAGLVLCCTRTGRTGEAFTWLALLRDLMDRGVPSYTGNDWAHAAILEAHLAGGLLDEGLAIGGPALEEYDRAGHQLTALRVRIRLGLIHAAQGNDGAARRHWESALPYAIEQSLPERALIEGRLAESTDLG